MERENKTDSLIRQEVRTRNILFLVFIFLAAALTVAACAGYQNFNRQHKLIITHIYQTGASMEVNLQFWYISVVLALIIISIGLIIWYIYQRKRLIFYRAQYDLMGLLKESESGYRRLFEAATDGILLIDYATELVLDVNPALVDLLGYPKVAFLKKHLWDIGAFKDVALTKDKLSELQKKKFFRYEGLTLETKAGKKILVEFVSNVYLAGDKKIIQCNIRDITARKQLEDELAQANEREYRTLLENLPQKVYLKNKNSVYISCNSNYACDLRIEPKEIAGKTDFDFFPTYLAEKYRADDKRVMESGKIEDIEEEYVVISDFLGSPKKNFINTVKIPMRDKGGNIAGVFGLFWDITERKRGEDKLYKSQQMFETIVNGITDAVLLLSLDYKVIWANNASVKHFGLPMEKILSQHCYNLTLRQEKRCRNSADHECPIKTVMKTGNPRTVLHTHINQKGESSSVEITVFPIKDKDGEIIQFLYLQRDITERKKTENELKRIEELKASTEMKLHFNSMVSHELRSPLVAIKEGINLVLEGLAGNINEQQKDLLDTAKRNADKLSRLINNAPDFKEIESAKVKSDIRQNDIKVEAQMAKKILVIDDEGDILKLVRTRLEANGYEVITLEGGESALEVVKSEKPQIILLDVVMAGKSGYEVCKGLKSDQATCKIPVIIFTAYYPEEDDVMMKSLLSCADDYLLKPFESQALLAKIKLLLK